MRASLILSSMLIGAILWTQGLAAPARGPVAQVTGVKGTVMMQNGGKGSWKAVRIFRNVALGDRLRVPQGGLVTLFFYGDTHRENISGELLLGVNDAGSDVPAGQRHKVVLTATPNSLRVAGASLQELGADMNGGIIVRDPLPRPLGVLTRVLPTTTSATLRWQPTEGAVKYQVIVQPGFGEDPLVEGSTVEPGWVVPVELQAGHNYVVKLRAEGPDGRLMGESVEPVETLSQDKQASLATARQEYLKQCQAHPNDVAPYMLMAARLASDHLLLEAIDILGDLSRVQPDSAWPHASMATLYGQLGLRAERQAALKRATALQQK